MRKIYVSTVGRVNRRFADFLLENHFSAKKKKSYNFKKYISHKKKSYFGNKSRIWPIFGEIIACYAKEQYF